MSIVRDDSAHDAEQLAVQDVDVQKRFIPTPEAISQYLENVQAEEIGAKLASVDGRDQVFQNLLAYEEQIREFDPNFSVEELRSQLDLVGETLRQKQRFVEDVQEKKGIFSRVWSRVKGFTKKHPIVTTALVLALAAAGVGAGFYLAGQWEVLLGRIGVEKWLGSTDVVKELIPPTPVTPVLPGGGFYDIPLPNLPPDIVVP